MASFGGTAILASAATASTTAIAAYVVGLLGNGIALFLYLSSMPTFINMWRVGSVGNTSVVSYLAALLNGVVWAMSGLPSVQPSSTLVLAVNAIGVACMIFYTVTYLRFAGEACYFYSYLLAFEVIISIVLGAVVLTVPETPENKAFLVGVFGDTTAILMYALPMWDMKVARDTQSVNHISLLKSAGALLNAGVWVAYSRIGDFNTLVFVPNITGVVVGVVLLGFYFYYYYKNAPADGSQEV